MTHFLGDNYIKEEFFFVLTPPLQECSIFIDSCGTNEHLSFSIHKPWMQDSRPICELDAGLRYDAADPGRPGQTEAGPLLQMARLSCRARIDRSGPSSFRYKILPDPYFWILLSIFHIRAGHFDHPLPL